MSIITAFCRCNRLQVLKTTGSLTRSKLFFSFQPVLTKARRWVSSNSVLDVNTNVTKDVLIYKNENIRQIKLLNLFAIIQFFFWNYLANTVYFTLKDIPVQETNDPDAPWYKKINLGNSVMKYSLTGLCLVVGNGLLMTAFLFTTRAVKYIVLKKGGQRVDLITYLPLVNKERLLNVGVHELSANEHRATARLSIPLKVKGKIFYYMIDMHGKFGNLRLFDATVGLRRKLQ